MTRHRHLVRALAGLAAWVATGCGNLTPGGFTGDATLLVSGDLDTLALAAPMPTSPPAFARPSLSSHEDEPEGEVEVEFLVFLVTETGSTVQLGHEEMRVRVDLQGRTEVDVIDRQIIPALRYTELRLIFTDIDAEVSGLIIDGVPITEVRVELEDLSLLVARPVELDVSPGRSVELVIDLNTPAWLQAVDPLTGSVDETVFRDLVDVVVR